MHFCHLLTDVVDHLHCFELRLLYVDEQFELHALMELISHVESQDFLSIGFVAEPKKSAEKVLTQRAQRLHARAQQLSV